MDAIKRCRFYVTSHYPGPTHGKTYCEVDGTCPLCNVNDELCKKLKASEQYLLQREWVTMRRENA